MDYLNSMKSWLGNLGKETYTAESPKSKYMKNATTTGQFTSYNPDKAQTDSRPREMASGKNIYDGAIASGDRSIPFGTQVYIPQLKRTFTVEDRMNQRYDATSTPYFDIPTTTAGKKDKKASKQFGRQNLDFVITGHDGRQNWGIGTSTPGYDPTLENNS